MKIWIASTALLLIAACSGEQPEPEAVIEAEVETPAPVIEADASALVTSTKSLDDILAGLPEADKARIQYRHPKETLAFFGVAPGMTIVDTSPGDIWYAGILAEYLGPEGKVIGADRPLAVWESFGPDYAPPEFLAERVNWPDTWPEKQAGAYGDQGAQFDAFAYTQAPSEMAQSVDIVLMIREMHNLISADESNALITKTLEEIHMMLKPDGVFGIVQHRAPEAASDAWANGSNGYLKQADIIALVEQAGFTLEAASEINANPKDQPTEADYVWRLAPSLSLPEGDAELRAAMLEIGESDRMTLKFRKAS